MNRNSLSLALTLISFAGLAQVHLYTDSHSSSSSNSRSSYYRSGNHIVIDHDGISGFNIEMRGKIELSDDDKDVKSISPDGYLEITKTTFGGRRAIVLTPQGDGIKREYYEGGEKVDFEKEGGRQWLGE